MSKLAKYLNERIIGNVFSRSNILEEYATSSSLFEIVPRLVAFPENTQDVAKLLKFSDRLAEQGYLLPITVRGNNHNQTGASLGDGLVLCTKKLNRIHEIDIRGRAVHAQAGITLGELNQVLREQGLWLPVVADPEMTLGGIISDARIDAVMATHGGIQAYIEQAEVVLANGEVVKMAPIGRRKAQQKGASDSLEGAIYRGLASERREDLFRLFYGAEGTLGVITELIINVEPLPISTERVLITANDARAAFRIARKIEQFMPASIQVIDQKILAQARDNGKFLSWCEHPTWVVRATFLGGKWQNRQIIKAIKRTFLGEQFVVDQTENFELSKELDMALASFLNEGLGGLERAPLLENVNIPTANLAKFCQMLADFEEKNGIQIPLYGNFLNQTYNLRPVYDLRNERLLQDSLNLARDIAHLVSESGGTIFADGAAGRWKELIADANSYKKDLTAERKIKQLFDPNQILNPDIKATLDEARVREYLKPRWPRGIYRISEF